MINEELVFLNISVAMESNFLVGISFCLTNVDKRLIEDNIICSDELDIPFFAMDNALVDILFRSMRSLL
mgnify:CR=1 FL=1